MKTKGLMYAAAALVPVLFLGLLLPLLLLGGGQPAAAGGCILPPGTGPDPDQVPVDGVAGYSGQQLVNAALIINAGRALDLSVRGQTIGVMTAMGESGLRVLDRGDSAGPDSRGLFQQRDNGVWGSYTDRMDPTISATNFFRALQRVPEWESMAPTQAASRVQRNDDPFHYEKYWANAIDVVTALTGTEGGPCLSPGPQLQSAGDDLPWPEAPYCSIGGPCPPGAVSPLGMYNRECTDFALWRLNAMAGVTGQPWKFHNSDLALGNADTWIDAWHRQGWTTGQEPQVGSVAYYGPGIGGAGPLGHVAIVSAVNEDGSVSIEEYNGQAPPNDHRYGTRTIRPGEVSAYLYYPSDT